MKKRFYASLASLVVVASAILLFNVLGADSQAALPRDCDNNSIIYCGGITAGELAQRYNENKAGDLPAIYQSYGLSAHEMTNAGTVAKMGEVRKDGTVVVNNEVVATDAMSIGRQPKNGSVPKLIGSKTYHNSAPSTSFASPSIVAYVFFNANGEFKSAVLTSCGNPVEGKPKPKPAYACKSLTQAKISRNEYNFTATAVATGGATIVGYRYEFGDGKTATSAANTIKHTYDAPGSYTAKVSVDIKVGDAVKTVTDPNCQVVVIVEEKPVYKCDSLTVRTIKLEDRSYAFDLTYTATGGAALKSVDYDFGDGQGRENVSPADAKTVTHAYAKAGTYTTTATLHFTDASGAIKDDKCKVTITTSPEMCPLNPSLPKDDARCAPCPIPGKEQYPKDSPLCVTPPVQELPKTGPADMVIGGLGIASIVAALYYWDASRRGLLATLLNR